MPGPSSLASLPKSVAPYYRHLREMLPPDDLAALLEEFRSDWTTPETTTGKALPGAELSWQTWLGLNFPHVCRCPFGERHRRLWDWFESLEQGVKPRARVEIWPRGGAKSTTVELGVTRVGVKLSRRFCLYVSETQEQADKHVQSIATLFERLGVERALGRYGASKGWRRDQLRTANGFNVAALGLDTAARGVKLDEVRPDLLVFDDIDRQDDTERTTQKKIASITTSILPAGSSDFASLFVQNLIHEESIFAQLHDGRADFLHDREPAVLEPAVYGLRYEKFDRGDGQQIYRVTGGEPSWAGQSLAVCETQINEWGLGAFLKEAQHEVRGANGYVFDVAQLREIERDAVPPLVAVCLAGDLAATEGAGDWTTFPVMGKAKNGTYYVFGGLRGQWASERVRGALKLAHAHYRAEFPGLVLRLPQDPGQAGKSQSEQLRKEFSGARILPITGDKTTRASGFAEQVNLGNVFLVQQDLPAWARTPSAETQQRPLMASARWQDWHLAMRNELRRFRADVLDQVDDQVDALSDAFNELSRPTRRPQFGTLTR